jgi:addiction module RelE/StbE family toxin
MPYRIFFTELGRVSLRALDKNIRRDIIRELAPLVDHPRQGDALLGSLVGIWSLHVQVKYRVLYRIDDDRCIVAVEFIGERKRGSEEDVYARATKLLTTILRARSR